MEAEFRDWLQITDATIGRSRNLDRQVGCFKRGDGVLVLRFRNQLLLRAIFQMETNLLGRFAEQSTAFGESDSGGCRIGDVGEKHAAPQRLAFRWNGILHVKDVVLEFLIEDTGLDLEGGLGSLQTILQGAQSPRSPWRHVDAVDHGENPRGNGK